MVATICAASIVCNAPGRMAVTSITATIRITIKQRAVSTRVVTVLVRIILSAALELALLEVGWLKSLDEKFDGLIRMIQGLNFHLVLPDCKALLLSISQNQKLCCFIWLCCFICLYKCDT